MGPQLVNGSDGADCLPTTLAPYYIVNEGNFGFGNGSITAYEPVNGDTYSNVFACKNDFVPGDVVQSMERIGSAFYIVANNSGVVQVVDATHFTHLATIDGFNSPRYVLQTGLEKAYVTDLYANGIWVVDMNTQSISGKINVAGWTEDMLLHNGKVFVLNRTSDRMYRINTSTNTIEDSLALARDPESMVVDDNGNIWVLCTGGFQEENPALLRIDPAQMEIEKTFIFSDINASPSHLQRSFNGQQLSWLNQGIYAMQVNALALPSTALIDGTQHVFYGYNLHKATNEHYVTDAIDYVQAGWCYRYHNNGTLIDSFRTGIIPGRVYFDE